ncbi:glycosyltransferase family 4 protein [Saccharata proteae CBS 121410]|uniref:Glycosyltransferase family 4 protein n=1 Tax=Saccharata proteae CBS 121410 TaxID=1314787 RepID=A0A9P4LUA9_9PEZI|nr:glycosyltransferase family 4 protein [Saccharata proteae CBS 121410]
MYLTYQRADGSTGRTRRQTWHADQAHTQTRHNFQASAPTKHLQRLEEARGQGDYGVELQTFYLGLAGKQDENGQVELGLASHDGTYSLDFAVHVISGHEAKESDPGKGPSGEPTPQPLMSTGKTANFIADHFISRVREYEKEHLYKFVGAGISKELFEMSPKLPSRLWWELDIVPMVFEHGLEDSGYESSAPSIDEEADAMARKCLMFFGPSKQPRVQVGFKNQVEVDCRGHAKITQFDQYPSTVGETTWTATMKYVDSLKKNGTKIAFFNSTPQGGGVALMRHALIRFLRLAGVDARWYVPKPKPEVFRITKTNHNILQGVADPNVRLTKEQQKTLDDWARNNAERFWKADGGPLAARNKGGVDVVIVDDPQLPSLVKIAKETDPERPVIFRSHIQVRSDLADQEGTPTAEVWQWVWDNVKEANVFISHPVKEFVPSNVDPAKVGWLPATTDWLDGLNKDMNEFTTQHYFYELCAECRKQSAGRLEYPKRPYIVQIARFDPSKGIPDVLASYAELRRRYMKDTPREDVPQLVIAGHGAVDDPDGSLILDQTLNQIDNLYSDLQHDICIMRLGPTDQLLNALMSNATVALQMSTREGFEVKVSEALHKGIPIVATKAGGIPLQVEDGKSGFLVEPSDSSAVAKYLNDLFTDHELYQRMSEYAATHVSDEVSTVGNALSWLYMADVLAKGHELEPRSRWVNDMAREAAGVPYEKGETRLPRASGTELKT